MKRAEFGKDNYFEIRSAKAFMDVNSIANTTPCPCGSACSSTGDGDGFNPKPCPCAGCSTVDE